MEIPSILPLDRLLYVNLYVYSKAASDKFLYQGNPCSALDLSLYGQSTYIRPRSNISDMITSNQNVNAQDTRAVKYNGQTEQHRALTSRDEEKGETGSLRDCRRMRCWCVDDDPDFDHHGKKQDGASFHGFTSAAKGGEARILTWPTRHGTIAGILGMKNETFTEANNTPQVNNIAIRKHSAYLKSTLEYQTGTVEITWGQQYTSPQQDCHQEERCTLTSHVCQTGRNHMQDRILFLFSKVWEGCLQTWMTVKLGLLWGRFVCFVLWLHSIWIPQVPL